MGDDISIDKSTPEEVAAMPSGEATDQEIPDQTTEVMTDGNGE